MEDKRRHSRAEAGFEAEVVMGSRRYPVVTRNLSMKGLLATANEDIAEALAEGSPCEVRIRLAPAVQIVVGATVIRADADSTAMEFTSMDDESFALLHRLMQWNAQDADIIDEELRQPSFS